MSKLNQNDYYTGLSGDRYYLFYSKEIVPTEKKKVKMLPARYAKQLGTHQIAGVIKENGKLRLSPEERFQLEWLLYLKKLQRDEPYVAELFLGFVPDGAGRVKTVHGESYYELNFPTIGRLKCPKILYDLALEKAERYSNV